MRYLAPTAILQALERLTVKYSYLSFLCTFISEILHSTHLQRCTIHKPFEQLRLADWENKLHLLSFKYFHLNKMTSWIHNNHVHRIRLRSKFSRVLTSNTSKLTKTSPKFAFTIFVTYNRTKNSSKYSLCM
jgi:hypothetical protein